MGLVLGVVNGSTGRAPEQCDRITCLEQKFGLGGGFSLDSVKINRSKKLKSTGEQHFLVLYAGGMSA